MTHSSIEVNADALLSKFGGVIDLYAKGGRLLLCCGKLMVEGPSIPETAFPRGQGLRSCEPHSGTLPGAHGRIFEVDYYRMGTLGKIMISEEPDVFDFKMRPFILWSKIHKIPPRYFDYKTPTELTDEAKTGYAALIKELKEVM